MDYLKLRLTTLLLSTLFLFACASTPSSLTLTPQINENIAITKIDSDKITNSWLLNSKDLRTARYIIAISSGDDVATLINESTNTRLAIEETLKGHWIKQGHQFNDEKSSPYQINIEVIKLLAEIEQGSVSHESDINVVIKVQLKSDKRTFSKTFRSHYEEKAPFSVNLEDLTAQLNTQLSQLLDQIVQDPELNAKLLQL